MNVGRISTQPTKGTSTHTIGWDHNLDAVAFDLLYVLLYQLTLSISHRSIRLRVSRVVTHQRRLACSLLAHDAITETLSRVIPLLMMRLSL